MVDTTSLVLKRARNQAGMAIHTAPASHRRHQARQHVQDQRQVEREADEGRREAAQEELALDADIEHAAAQRDAGGDAA